MGIQERLNTLKTDTTKTIGVGSTNLDGDIIFPSLTVPTNKKVIFIVVPGGDSPYVDHIWCTMSELADRGFMVLGPVLATDFKSYALIDDPEIGYPSYPEIRKIWTAGTYENIKLYARQIWWISSTNEQWGNGQAAMWIALEVFI